MIFAVWPKVAGDKDSFSEKWEKIGSAGRDLDVKRGKRRLALQGIFSYFGVKFGPFWGQFWTIFGTFLGHPGMVPGWSGGVFRVNWVMLECVWDGMA